MSDPLTRAAAGALVALLISTIALRNRTLTSDGAAAAFLTGTAAIAAGWAWGLLLIAFFVTGSGLSRLGRERKDETTSGIVDKGDERDAAQVLANGGAFTAAAIGSLLFPSEGWAVAGAAAIAAATSDTWATEVGTVFQTGTRSITSGRPVPTGTSGGVSVPGSIAALAGSAMIAVICIAMGWPRDAAAAAITGGIAGSLLDSVLGATVQARRWCAQCGRGTERTVHDCGAATRAAGGAGWIDNDVVNAMSTIGGMAAGGLWAV